MDKIHSAKLRFIGKLYIAENWDLKGENDEYNKRVFSAALPLVLGVVLNSCGLWENHVFGLTLGSLWGMAFLLEYESLGYKSVLRRHDER